MRRALPWSLLLLVVPIAMAWSPPRHALVRAQGDLEPRVYLPLTLRGARMDFMPTPVVVPATSPSPFTATPTTPAATRQPTLTPTIRVPPSLTPEPAATPTSDFGATITGLLTVKGEPLWEGMGEGIGPGLFLQRCPPSGACVIVSRTAVDAEGRYTFTVPEPLASGEAYQVVWWNSSETVQDHRLEGADLWLGRWFGPRITAVEPGDRIQIPAVELGDVLLLVPTHGTGFQGFPIPFQWARWPGSGGRYRWSLCLCCQTKAQRDGAYQQSVGSATQYELTGLPPGFRYDERYCWYIHVDMGTDRGYGESFAVRMMWFVRELALGTSAGAPAACDGARAGPAAQVAADGPATGARLHLPLTLRGLAIQALPTAGAVTRVVPTTTAPATATAPPTATPVTPPPTITPLPTWTAEPTEPAVTSALRGRIVFEGQPLYEGYGAPGGPQIELRRCSAADGGACLLAQWERVANTMSLAGGEFVFRSPPALEDGQRYQVWWVNDDTDEVQGDGRFLNRWWSRAVTAFGPGDDVDLGTFDVTDLKYQAICHDCGQSLPITFKWQPRTNRSDAYRWSLYRGCGDSSRREAAYRTRSLGRAREHTLESPPPGFRLDEKYCWYVFIEDGANGSGWPFFDWRVTFLSALQGGGAAAAPPSAAPALAR